MIPLSMRKWITIKPAIRITFIPAKMHKNQPAVTRDRLMSVKSLDLQTSHAYHFKVALQRLWHINAAIAENYLRKWISWASRSRMPDIIKLAKTIRRHLDGIMEAIRTEINSAVVEGLNNKIRTAFKRSYGFKAQEYRDTIIYLVAGGLKLPPEC